MRGKSIHPRPAHIAELTRGQTLPLEPISEIHLEIIADYLAQEWSELLHSCPEILASDDEVEANASMEIRLNNLDDPIWRSLVSLVVRGADTISHDGSHLEKKPDLSIHLTNRHRNFRLEVECKLIDRTKGRTVNLYAKQGLARFLSGEYAWATREAFMLAFVRDGSFIRSTLVPFLEKHKQGALDLYNTEALPTFVGTRMDLARSVHGRSFSYVHQQPPSSPGPITIWHLWL